MRPQLLSLIASRVMRALTVLFGVSLLTFVVGHMSGDPVLLMVREDATAQQKADLRHALGLDRPVLVQYASYVAGALHGDLGVSYRQRVSVAHLIALRAPNSILLAVSAFVLAMLGGLGLGLLAALNRGRWVDHLVTALSLLTQVAPGFWLGLMLVLLFAVRWRLLPVSGAGDLRHLILPVITLAAPTLGRTARLVRSGLIDVMASDFIRTARAKGLNEMQILVRHAIRNALIPLITQAGLELGDMVGSAFVVETVFAWPGLGRLAVNAVLQRDFLVVQGCVLVTATAFVLINMLVDVAYAVIDPRVRVA